LTEYVPGTAALLALKVRELVVLVMAGLKVADTPIGSPVSVKATLLLEPFAQVTSIVLPALPPTRRLRALCEDESVKLGSGMVNVMLVVLVRVPEVPITFTV
jgi:hypothetical protein